MRKFRNRGNKAGAREAWLLLHKDGVGELCEVKARHGSPMVRVYASPACIYGVTCVSLKTRFMHSIVTQTPWSTCTLKLCLNYRIVSSAFGIQNT